MTSQNNADTIVCPHCGGTHSASAAFCPITGKSLQTQPRQRSFPLWMIGAAGVAVLLGIAVLWGGLRWLKGRGTPPQAAALSGGSSTPAGESVSPAKPTPSPLPATPAPSPTRPPTATPLPASSPTATPVPTAASAYEWTVQTLQRTGNVGYFNSLVLDSLGYLHLGYFQETSDMVWHAHNDSGEWLFDYVLGGVGNGIDLTLALDSKDNPHYGYRVKGKKVTPEIKYVYWDGSHWQTIRAYGSYVADTDISMALGPEDHPHFSYLDGYSYVVTYATYTPQKGWKFQTVDNGNPGCRSFPIAVDSGGIPHLVYQSDKGGLRYAALKEEVWKRSDVDMTNGAGVYSDLTVAPDGSIHIAYYDAAQGSLKYAYQGDDGSWQVEVVDSEGDVGQFPSIKVDANGEVYIAYYDAVHTALKFAHRRNGQWSVVTVDDQGDVGRYASLVVDPSGMVYIAYLDRDREDAKLAQGFRVGK